MNDLNELSTLQMGKLLMKINEEKQLNIEKEKLVDLAQGLIWENKNG